MSVMPRGCERGGGECLNSPTAPIARNTTISPACSRSWRLKLLSMPARWIDPARRIGSPRGEAVGRAFGLVVRESACVSGGTIYPLPGNNCPLRKGGRLLKKGGDAHDFDSL